MRKPVTFLWILCLCSGMIFSAECARGDEKGGYNAHAKRDPFVPLVTMTTRQASGLLGVENREDITIEGLVYDPASGSIVIANGTVLREGEQVGNLKVIEVKSNGAIFSVNEMQGFVPLYQEKAPQEATDKND